MALTDTAIRNPKPDKKPYKKSDGDGLYLLVMPEASKLWRLAYRFAGKQKTISSVRTLWLRWQWRATPGTKRAPARLRRRSVRETQSRQACRCRGADIRRGGGRVVRHQARA